MDKQLTNKIRLIQQKTNWPVSKILTFVNNSPITLEQFYNFYTYAKHAPNKEAQEWMSQWQKRMGSDFGLATAEHFQNTSNLN